MTRHRRQRRSGFAGRGVMILALAVAVAATIPLGSVGFMETRLVAALAWLVGVLALLWPRPRNETPPEKSGAARTIALLLGLWCGVQGWPYSARWAAWAWRGDAALLREVMADAAHWSLAWDRFVSLHALLLWAGLGILAWGCARQLRERSALVVLLIGLMLLGTFQSIFGIFLLRDSVGRVCGTFGSPDALGGLLAMTLPASLGLIFHRVGQRTLRGRSGLRWWLHRLSDDWHAWVRPALWTAWFIQWAGLLFSGSRGAALAAVVVCGAMLVWQARERVDFRGWLVVLGVALAVGLVVFSLRARRTNVLERTLGDSVEFQVATVLRTEIWQAAWRLCRTFPLGTGPGGSALAMPMFQGGVHGVYRLDFAHNDPLQFLGDLGWPGGLLLLALLGLTLWRGARAGRSAPVHERDPAWLIRGAMWAVLAAMLHAQVEFNLSARPGIQVVFALLCGALWATPARKIQAPAGTSAVAPPQRRFRLAGLGWAVVGAAAIYLSLSAARAWQLREGAVAAAGLPLDKYLWFRRPALDPAAVPDTLRQAQQLAPGFSDLRQVSAEVALTSHRQRVEQTARTLLPKSPEESGIEASLDPLNPVHAQALELAGLALRVEEVALLRSALDDADAAVQLAPWNAAARLVRARILLRGAAIRQLGAAAEARGLRDLELAAALYPQDAGVLAKACSALAAGPDPIRNQEDLLAWGGRAMALDASSAWTVLEAWWAGKIPLVRVLELPHMPISVLWTLYARLENLQRKEDSRACLQTLERRLATEAPPESARLWTSAQWKRWNIQQTQFRIRLVLEKLRRNLREGDWDAVQAASRDLAQARRDRFQIELDRMELDGTASATLRRLRMREWATRGALAPEWTLEWALHEMDAGTPLREFQEPLAETLLMEELDSEHLVRLGERRVELSESPFLAALLAAREAAAAEQPEAAATILAAMRDKGHVPAQFLHRIWFWQAQLLRRTGQAEVARDALAEAARLCPSDPDVRGALAESGQPDGANSACSNPDLDVGFYGRRLLLAHACMEPAQERGGDSRLHLVWRFRGRLPADLRLDLVLRDAEGYARIRKAVLVDREIDAKFNRGNPAVGSAWIWTVPVSSFAAKSQTLEVRVRGDGRAQPSDDGLGAVELNLAKLSGVADAESR